MGCAIKRKDFTVTNNIIDSFGQKYISLHQANTIDKGIKNIHDKLPVNKAFFITIRKKALEDYYDVASFIYRSDTTEVAKIKHKEFDYERTAKIFPVRNEKIPHKRLMEFNILKSMDHINIIKIYDCLLEYNRCCFILDAIGSNQDIFSTIMIYSPLSEISYISIIRQLFNVLKYLHTLKIFHFNIQSNNILAENINSRNHGIIHSYLKVKEKDIDIVPVLIDFSRAVFFSGKSIEINTDLYHFNEYTAPEVLNGLYSTKSEIWSMGVVIFKILTGIGFYTLSPSKTNFTPNDWKILIKSKRNNLKAKQSQSLSLDMTEFLEAVLDPDPDNRPSIDEIFNLSLFKSVKVLDEDKGFPLFKRIFMNILDQHYLITNKFYKQSALFCIHNSPKLQLNKSLLSCFSKLNIEKNGLIEYKDFIEGLRQINFVLKYSKDYKALYEAIDLNKDGYITYTEFLSVIISKEEIFTLKNITYLFQYISSNKEIITLPDMSKFLGIKNFSGYENKELKQSLYIIYNDILNEEHSLCQTSFVNVIKAIGILESEEKNKEKNFKGLDIMFGKNILMQSGFDGAKIFRSKSNKLTPMSRNKTKNTVLFNKENETKKIKKRKAYSWSRPDIRKYIHDPAYEKDYLLKNVDKILYYEKKRKKGEALLQKK